MKYLIINTVAGADSPGRIAANICRDIVKNGDEAVFAYSRTAKNCDDIKLIKIGCKLDYYCHAIITRLFDRHGLGSKLSTQRFLRWMDEYKPDIIWMHNIHGYFINYPMLFDWIKNRRVSVKWTLHDCWAFTGHCAYFTRVGCEKWKSGCEKCPQLNTYPKSLSDYSSQNYLNKMKAFCGVENMEIITPSMWLADLVKQSFLKDYPVTVINNRIDHNIFYRRTVVNKYAPKKVLLAVANGWGPRKGEQDIYQLAKKIPNDYVIVMVGLSEKQIQMLPSKKIVGIEKTESQNELAELYSIADWFINPTYEDNYPTVNLEAEACGCRVITYNVGGCSETINDKRSVAIETGVDNILRVLTLNNEDRK